MYLLAKRIDFRNLLGNSGHSMPACTQNCRKPHGLAALCSVASTARP